jgi:electron transfer DM13
MLALRSHRVRVAVALAAAAGVALTAFVLVWFQPQKLFIDDRVDEALPAAPANPPPGDGAPTAPQREPMLRTLALAPFHSHEHATEGRARVIDVPGDRRYVRFERFRTSNGPLLRVYLSAARADGPGGAFDDRFVDLGALKGNIGAQNYAIPARTDLGDYRSVVVWCKRFGVPFAAAPVTAAGRSA